jgi:DNA-binding transcriptional MerR regulator
MKKLLSTREVSAETGFAEGTLKFWRATGIGPPSARIGRRVVYREDDLIAWIEAQFKGETAS